MSCLLPEHVIAKCYHMRFEYGARFGSVVWIMPVKSNKPKSQKLFEPKLKSTFCAASLFKQHPQPCQYSTVQMLSIHTAPLCSFLLACSSSAKKTSSIDTYVLSANLSSHWNIFLVCFLFLLIGMWVCVQILIFSSLEIDFVYCSHLHCNSHIHSYPKYVDVVIAKMCWKSFAHIWWSWDSTKLWINHTAGEHCACNFFFIFFFFWKKISSDTRKRKQKKNLKTKPKTFSTIVAPFFPHP